MTKAESLLNTNAGTRIKKRKTKKRRKPKKRQKTKKRQKPKKR